MALPNGILVTSNDVSIVVLVAQKYQMILVASVPSCQMALVALVVQKYQMILVTSVPLAKWHLY